MPPATQFPSEGQLTLVSGPSLHRSRPITPVGELAGDQTPADEAASKAWVSHVVIDPPTAHSPVAAQSKALTVTSPPALGAVPGMDVRLPHFPALAVIVETPDAPSLTAVQLPSLSQAMPAIVESGAPALTEAPGTWTAVPHLPATWATTKPWCTSALVVASISA